MWAIANQANDPGWYADACMLASQAMPDGLIPILVLIALVIIYTIAKIVGYMRKSEQQWLEVDKSKLKEWDDEDD